MDSEIQGFDGVAIGPPEAEPHLDRHQLLARGVRLHHLHVAEAEAVEIHGPSDRTILSGSTLPPSSRSGKPRDRRPASNGAMEAASGRPNVSGGSRGGFRPATGRG